MVEVGEGVWRTQREQELVDAYREALRLHINTDWRKPVAEIEAKGGAEPPTGGGNGPESPAGDGPTETGPSARADVAAYYDARTHEDTGMVVPAVLKEQDGDGSDRTVYIVQGNVVRREDGTIDVAASDPRLIVVNEAGEREMISPTALLSVEEPMDAALLKQQVMAAEQPATPVEEAPAASENVVDSGEEAANLSEEKGENGNDGTASDGVGENAGAMPMKKNGEEDWAAVTPERAHTYLYGGEAGLTRAEADAFVAARQKAAQAAKTKAEKAATPSLGTAKLQQ